MMLMPVLSFALAATMLALPEVRIVDAPAGVKPGETYTVAREVSAEHAEQYSDWTETQMQPAFIAVGQSVLQACSQYLAPDMDSFGVVLVLTEEGRMHRYMTDAPPELGVCVARSLAGLQFPEPPVEGIHFAFDILVGQDT